MTSTSELERLVRPSDLRGRRSRHSGRRGWFGTVSDAVVAGDIQITGDGTATVLMRDHQPTGGYPRIATIITADLDRFAQARPSTEVAFQPVTVEHAHAIWRRANP